MKRYRGLTQAQFDALCGIAFGGRDAGYHPKTIKVLLDKGLIESFESVNYGKGNSPIDRIPMTITRYQMPLAEHIKLCYWCSDQPEAQLKTGGD